ncbi:DUF1801 domain-containing protein [Undibacterium sp. TJN19]|uniref:DUF1801 domain-containing protein n=1 Tax=Undibacterium sp. TJN19 TaxID=3413055 RepID=UPI003BF1248D
MADNQTKATEQSVEEYIAAIDDESRRKDCQALIKLMTKVTRQPAVMWGSSIVGFGSIHYQYESGREGDICLVGFASRKGDISVYGLRAAPNHEQLLASLGKTRSGKGCLYIRKLADIDMKVFETLIKEAVTAKGKA